MGKLPPEHVKLATGWTAFGLALNELIRVILAVIEQWPG
jgi:hypothetical protein